MENIGVMNDGIVITNEKRSTVDKIKSWYKRNIIDSGISQKFENRVEKNGEAVKKIIKVVGVAATVALVFCPADGPFGELCTALATPALCALVDKIVDVEKKLTITAKRAGERMFGFNEGVNPDIKEYTSAKEVLKDAFELKNNINTYSEEVVKKER